MSTIIDRLREIFPNDGEAIFQPKHARPARSARVMAAILLEEFSASQFLSPGECETILDGAQHALTRPEKQLVKGLSNLSELTTLSKAIAPSLGAKLAAFADYHRVMCAEGEEPSTIDWNQELPDQELAIVATMYQMGRWPSLSQREYSFDQLRAHIKSNASTWCSPAAARHDWNNALLPLGLTALQELGEAKGSQKLRASLEQCARHSIPTQGQDESLHTYLTRHPQVSFLLKRKKHRALINRFSDETMALGTALDGYRKGWERFTPLRDENGHAVSASIIAAIDQSVWGELKKAQRKESTVSIGETCWNLAVTIRKGAAIRIRDHATWEECVHAAAADLPEEKRKKSFFDSALQLALTNAETDVSIEDLTRSRDKHGDEHDSDRGLHRVEACTFNPFTIGPAVARLHSEVERLMEVIVDTNPIHLNALRTHLAEPAREMSPTVVKSIEGFLEESQRPEMLKVFKAVMQARREAPTAITIAPVAELLTRPLARKHAASQLADHLIRNAESTANTLRDK